MSFLKFIYFWHWRLLLRFSNKALNVCLHSLWCPQQQQQKKKRALSGARTVQVCLSIIKLQLLKSRGQSEICELDSRMLERLRGFVPKQEKTSPRRKTKISSAPQQWCGKWAEKANSHNRFFVIVVTCNSRCC